MADLPKAEFQCNKCGRWSPSPWRLTPEMFDGATVARNETNCPVCGALVPINKENVRWNITKEGFVGSGTTGARSTSDPKKDKA